MQKTMSNYQFSIIELKAWLKRNNKTHLEVLGLHKSDGEMARTDFLQKLNYAGFTPSNESELIS